MTVSMTDFARSAGLRTEVFSRRNFIGLSLGALVSGCASYIPDGRTTLPQLSRETIIAKINRVRTDNGRKPLSYNGALARAARIHANLMAARGELSHTVGGTLRERVNAAGYFGAVGENLAGGQRTLEGAIQGWMESAGHRSTLLSPRFTEFGLAAASGGGEYTTYWALIMGGTFEAWKVGR